MRKQIGIEDILQMHDEETDYKFLVTDKYPGKYSKKPEFHAIKKYEKDREPGK